MLVFVTPHQFTAGICKSLKGKLMNSNVRAISLTKGMEIDENGFHLMSQVISNHLGIDCSVLMGANIANEIAVERFSEATVGYSILSNGNTWAELFNTPYFQIRIIDDVPGPEMCGTLKNIVAIGAGMVDGLKLGNNSKAAIIRIGMQEIIKLSKMFFPTVKDATFFESCGIADLITTCFGGRNRKCGEAFVLARGEKTFVELEAELLGGQKLQGVLTSDEVQHVLKKIGKENEFPLFTTINRIINGHLDPIQIVDYADLPQSREDMSPQARAHE
uniref:Glycerol-3-phosphate dehydrogenase [NAD(+)] n=1 Tax=Arcella intermedia TaxID=1963864 RepID=A0A6B2LA30_9EUKA